jgi:hypothetical protein
LGQGGGGSLLVGFLVRPSARLAKDKAMPMLTAADQILWTQRIEKELKVNGGKKGEFSLRAAVNQQDVPSQFKCGHVDPSKASRAEEFDPASIGWDPQSETSKEFRRCINAQGAEPRQRHQFPQTAMQELGWCQSRGGEVALRAGPAGSCPTKLGLGWLQKDGHGGVLAAGVGNADGSEVSEPVQRKTKDRNPRENFGVAPFATSTGAQAREVARRAGTIGDRDALASLVDGGSNVTASAPRSQCRPSAPPSVLKASAPPSALRPSAPASLLRPAAPASVLSATAPTALSKASSLPALSSNPHKLLNHQEQQVEAMLQESRRYMNRHTKNAHYFPLSNSDVNNFADAYTKAFGQCIFHQKKLGR